MVKEGHDSTVRPKVQTYEFDNGRMFLDAWASDGKANLSKPFLGRMRVLQVLACTSISLVLVLSDWGGGEHVFSPLRRGLLAWWDRFREMDTADVAKARSVGAPIGPRGSSRNREARE